MKIIHKKHTHKFIKKTILGKGIKITESKVFIKKKKRYYHTHEFQNIEEIYESRGEIENNLSKIEFKTNNSKLEKKVVEIKLNKEINKAKQILLTESLSITNPEQKICTIKAFRSKNELIMLIKIEVRIK